MGGSGGARVRPPRILYVYSFWAPIEIRIRMFSKELEMESMILGPIPPNATRCHHLDAQMPPEASRCLQVASRCSHMRPGVSCYQMLPDAPRCSQMLTNGLSAFRWPQMLPVVPDVPNRTSQRPYRIRTEFKQNLCRILTES